MVVFRWGNSLAVRLPAAVARALNLKEGDEIEVNVAGPRDIAIARTPDRAALLERVRTFRGRLPAAAVFDRDGVNAR